MASHPRQHSSVIVIRSGKKGKGGDMKLSRKTLTQDKVPPWTEDNMLLLLHSLRETVRRDRAATSLTHLYNGEIGCFRIGELK
jgi:hypothetical protein